MEITKKRKNKIFEESYEAFPTQRARGEKKVTKV